MIAWPKTAYVQDHGLPLQGDTCAGCDRHRHRGRDVCSMKAKRKQKKNRTHHPHHHHHHHHNTSSALLRNLLNHLITHCKLQLLPAADLCCILPAPLLLLATPRIVDTTPSRSSSHLSLALLFPRRHPYWLPCLAATIVLLIFRLSP